MIVRGRCGPFTSLWCPFWTGVSVVVNHTVTSDTTPTYYTAREAAAVARCSERTIRKAVARRELRADRVGNRLRIKPAELEQYLARPWGPAA